MKKLKLHGFNNLTKNLSFNIYDICYTQSAAQRKQYIEYIDEAYNASRLTEILTEVSRIMGAFILNVATQDYDPIGASVTMLIAEEPVQTPDLKPIPKHVVAHLDKSHIAVHTYPESHPENNICTFRVDIDVSTCGVISPLKALNFLIKSFDSDIVTADYRVRGFTRDVQGSKHFIDHSIHSIQDYIAEDNLQIYEMIDVNVYQENLFHTKMRLREFELDNYLFDIKSDQLKKEERESIFNQVRREMLEIFYGRNL